MAEGEVDLEQQYHRQATFTEQWLADYRQSHPEATRVEITKELILALHKEADELLDELPWKTHRAYAAHDAETDAYNVREEVIDIIKYAFEIAIVWGVPYVDLVREFDVKSDVVDDRWRQDHDHAIGDRPIALIDLDGVLNDYPEPFLEFVERQTGRRFESMEDLETQNLELKLRLKHIYRQSGIKRLLPAREDSVYACRLLVSAGYDLLIMSQRPYREYPRIYADTVYWLRSQGITYRRLFFVENKQSKLLFSPLKEAIRFAVDDDPDVVDRLRDLGIKTYHISKDLDERGRVIASMLEIEEVREVMGGRRTKP